MTCTAALIATIYLNRRCVPRGAQLSVSFFLSRSSVVYSGYSERMRGREHTMTLATVRSRQQVYKRCSCRHGRQAGWLSRSSSIDYTNVAAIEHRTTRTDLHYSDPPSNRHSLNRAAKCTVIGRQIAHRHCSIIQTYIRQRRQECF